MGARNRKPADPAPAPAAPVADPPGQAPVLATGAPVQATWGAVDLWPFLRDPASVEAVARGDLDPVLVELSVMSRSHALEALGTAIRDRAAGVGLSLDVPVPAPTPEPKPFRWAGRVTKG